MVGNKRQKVTFAASKKSAVAESLHQLKTSVTGETNIPILSFAVKTLYRKKAKNRIFSNSKSAPVYSSKYDETCNHSSFGGSCGCCCW